MRNAAEMLSFDPNQTSAKNAWSSSTCLLYGREHDLYSFYPSFWLPVMHQLAARHAPAGCPSCTSRLPVMHQLAARPDSTFESEIEAKRLFCLEAKKVYFRLFRIEVKQHKSEAKMNEK